MSTLSNVCTCEPCVGTECTCGCQNPAPSPSSCQCGDACTCGDTCTCTGCRHASALAAEGR